MKRPIILLVLAVLFNISFAQLWSVNAQLALKEEMKKRIRNRGECSIVKDISLEMRKYTHPLLRKYLLTYKFYVPYIPAHKNIYSSEYNTYFPSARGEYSKALGIVDQKNHLFVFYNLVDAEGKGPKDYTQISHPLVQDFLKTAKIKRYASSRTDNEMREITRVFFILGSLKGLNGCGLLKSDQRGLPSVRDIETKYFKVVRKQREITVRYYSEIEHEECSLTFDLKGNIIGGKAYSLGKSLNVL